MHLRHMLLAMLTAHIPLRHNVALYKFENNLQVQNLDIVDYILLCLGSLHLPDTVHY